MRTTITLDDRLLADVKRLAADTGRSVSAVVEDAVRESLGRRRQTPSQRAPVELPTFRGGGGLRPGVDLDSNAGVLDAMETRRAPR